MKHDVTIVGGGPVGLTLALLLAEQGTRVVLIEKERAPETLLRAVSLDDECLRIWQSCGLENAIRCDWASGEPGAVMCRYQNARGRDFLCLRQHQSDLGYPCAVVVHQTNISQTLLHAVIKHPAVELLTGVCVKGISQDNVHTTAYGTNSSGETFSVSAPWLVACDGANSGVRQQLGIEMPGVTLEHPWLVADLADKASGTFANFRCVPSEATVSLPLPNGVRRVECMLDAHDQGEWITDDTVVRSRLVRGWPGASDAAILHRGIHRFNARIASRWRDRRVFLAGDAAHTTPPFAGQGMATGLRDAANLAFKLAGVRQGWLSKDVLDTYERERRPHQERMNRLALRLGSLMMPRSSARAVVTQSAIRTLTKVSVAKERIELRGPSMRPVFRGGFLIAHGRGGHMLPQPWVTTTGTRRTRLDSLLGPRMTWIAIGSPKGNGRLPSGLISTADTVLVEGRDFRDHGRSLQRTLGPNSLVLVRPDRVIHTHLSSRHANSFSSRSTLCFSSPTRQPCLGPQHAPSV